MYLLSSFLIISIFRRSTLILSRRASFTDDAIASSSTEKCSVDRVVVKLARHASLTESLKKRSHYYGFWRIISVRKFAKEGKLLMGDHLARIKCLPTPRLLEHL